MQFPRLQRLGEIQQRLKPVLDQLGVKPKLQPFMGRQFISFENDDGSLVHPLAIMLANVHDAPADVWRGAKLSISDIGEMEIGDNGWRYSYDNGEITSVTIEEDDQVFSLIEQALKAHSVVRMGDSHPDLFSSLSVVEVYREIEDMIRQLTRHPLKFERTDGVMSINFFEDTCGDTWRITFEEKAPEGWHSTHEYVVLYVNGEKVDETRDGAEAVYSMIYKTIGRFNLDYHRYDLR